MSPFAPRCIIAACTLLALTAGHAQAVVTFSDSTFANSGWQIQSETFGTSATAAGAQVTTGGNPAEARRVTLTRSAAEANIFALNLFGNTTATRYVPATQGAIASVSFTVDARFISGAAGHALYVGLRQGSSNFISAPLGLVSSDGTWATYATSGLTALDFANVNGSSSVDFSASGAPIRVGFAAAFGANATGSYVVDYDNFRVDVNQVPSPAGASVLAGSLVILARRRR